VNTEHLPGQLDIEDAILEAQEDAEEALEIEPQRLHVNPANFRRFIAACWRNPRIRRQAWPHLVTRRMPTNRAERRKDFHEARLEYKRIGYSDSWLR